MTPAAALRHRVSPPRLGVAGLRPTQRTLLLVLAALASGCVSSSAGRTLEESVAHYEAGRYALAHASAAAALERGGPSRPAAAYLSGLSAYRLGDYETAQTHLVEAADDPATAANAKAVLGLVRLEQDRGAEAARLFREASPGLDPHDAAQAARFAAAASPRSHAASAATPAPVARAGGAFRPGGEGRFALQVGAFRNRRRAEHAADDARLLAARAGLGSPRVTSRPGAAGVLWVVQLGHFDSRGEAVAARTRMRRPEYIVVSTTVASAR